ncbi:hypothetical protein [Dolosigranulum pigrum]|uniref:hypothetical protein n=1 Tax=Dolosigranulum pigrum TaxID=29394 RepID=UPI001AD86BCD|nr:hypothetical protein [Dolosigranulum pigrum]
MSYAEAQHQMYEIFHKSRRYNFYRGKVGKVVRNRVNRRFMTSIPLQKLVTDGELLWALKARNILWSRQSGF